MSSLDGELEAVRLVGVDARESGGPYQDVECFGLEGAQFLDSLLGRPGQLFIEKDREEQDRFGRLLRWVWLDIGDGTVYLLNEALIRAGQAERFRDTPNQRYVDKLIAAEEFAQRHQLGLWADCDTGLDGHETPTCYLSALRVPAVTPPTRTSAFRRHRQISPAVTFPTPGSAYSHPIHTTSTATSMASPARVPGSQDPGRDCPFAFAIVEPAASLLLGSTREPSVTAWPGYGLPRKHGAVVTLPQDALGAVSSRGVIWGRLRNRSSSG